MSYFLRHSYCIGVALVLAALISLLTGGLRWELLPLFTLLAYCVRLLDDHHDYDTDTKPKPLTKKTLLLLLIVFFAVYAALNLLFFGVRGLLCLLPVACAVLQNRVEVLKLFFLSPCQLDFFFFLCHVGFCEPPACFEYSVRRLHRSFPSGTHAFGGE